MKERVKALCKAKGVSMNLAESEIGLAKGYISKLDKTNPNLKTLQKIADYFGVSVEYLSGSEEKEGTPGYYLDDDAREYAQFLFENPEYKVLFDTSRKVKKEDIQFVKEMIDRVRGGDADE